MRCLRFTDPVSAPACRIGLGLLFAGGLLLTGTAQAQQQLTFAPAGQSTTADIDAAGARVVFQSTANLDDGVGNADGSSEIFAVDADGANLVQLTQSALASTQPAIAGDGSRVAFVSSADLTGGNADGGPEIFLVDASDGGNPVQVTDTGPGSGIAQPDLSADANRIAFTATANLTGENGDASRELFAVDADGENLVQLTTGPAGTAVGFARLQADGSQVVFSSAANFAGSNGNGNSEIFLVDADGSESAVQLTDTVGGASIRPDIADNGRIAFESTAALDDNPQGTSAVFVMDTDGDNLQALTDADEGSAGFVRIAGDGSRVVFQATAGVSGDNPDGNPDVFIVDADGDDPDRLTSGGLASEQPAIAGGAGQVAFQSAANLSGNNAEGNVEIFIIDPADADDDDDGGNGGGVGDDSFVCDSLGSGCSFCDDDDQTAAVDRGVDPLFALLCGIAVWRIRARGRPAGEKPHD
ncbi:hypothetical protein RM531_10940 [Salinisphaera sp. P385]|uniref:WD40 repeat protein n=1 Tax=Spectribacter acetivorans TaxID=3075603 RepID=A0ABU3BAZ7_9GAMM|nr:hypothetical protein [Salinisphaera sp. P385]MDT0618992.1 hypothetical protein [Salinisphaera sp. P385]